MTKHLQIAPPDHLAPYIYCFGLLENNAGSHINISYKLTVDGCPGMIFQENPNSFTDLSGKKLPQLFLHGIATTPSEKKSSGTYSNVGIYFKPHAIKSFFGIDACELTNTYTDISDLININLVEKLMLVKTIEQRVAFYFRFFS